VFARGAFRYDPQILDGNHVVEQITLASLPGNLQFLGDMGGYIIEDRIRFSSFLFVFHLVNNARYVIMILVPWNVPGVCLKGV
jgi:hypothetical protein